MAIGNPSVSPAVITREIDLTNGVPNSSSSTGAMVGSFRWGPADEPILVNNEGTLVSTFGNPDDDTSVDFHSAAYFLKYSSDLYIVRMVDEDSALNACDDSSGVALIKNLDHFEEQEASLTGDLYAKYPGDLGNSLKVEICNDSDYDSWAYKDEFDAAPGLSQFAEDIGATGTDEVHVVVLDEDGEISGTKGKVLEVFPFVSVGTNAKNADGTTNYIKNVINNGSTYVWMAGIPGIATPVAISNGSAMTTAALQAKSLADGSMGNDLTQSDYQNGFDNFEDKDTITVDMLIAPSISSATDQNSLVNDLVSIAAGTNGRKDCIVVASPARSTIIGRAKSAMNAQIITDVNFTRSSYLVVDNNFLKVYDKYNDKYVFIPAASSTAGLMAATDRTAAPWFSPAGTRRGQYLGVTALAYTPSKTERDTLYKNGINPIANIPGNGVLLYGDKTHLNRPSAFDRINVRRLFLVIERAIAEAAENVLFEFNDEFTRAEFVNIVEPVLRDIKGRRGITDFSVVCDETNNTGDIIDANQFVASMFIKPARSINFITLNFVAVRTGVSFEEVVGQV